ncbi:MAG: TIM barrel protein, partial [Oscillospiraceae bacterium]
MFKTGLVSVSFRDKSPEEIIDAAVESRLNGIEWSGAHIPTGDIETATQIKYLCDKNGLQIFSYGSYFRLGVNETADFEAEVSVAAALGAKFLRIWCYDKGSNDIGNSTFDELVSQAQAVCRIARTHDITVTLECHHSTLTDDYKTTLAFLHQVNEENLKMYWQPNQFKDDNYNLLAAHALSDFTVCLHVFCWDSESRYPLKNGFKL